MILRVCAFTDAGRRLVDRVEAALPGEIVERRRDEPLERWVEESFAMNSPTLFVGACGIAARAVAPFVRDKTLDSPVVVMDEKGKFAIPILSGHLGGANRLAVALAEKLGATPVITTATDLNGLFAVDLFAADNALRVVNREGIVAVSKKILEKGEIEISIDPRIAFQIDDVPQETTLRPFPPRSRVDVVVAEDPRYWTRAALALAPKPFVLGVGCKKGTSADAIERLVAERADALRLNDWRSRVAAVATVDLKRREYGLVLFAARLRVPLCAYSAAELRAVEGDFSDSEFVRRVAGVANVCERAAMRRAGDGAELILKKTAGGGATIAIAKRKAVIETWKRRSIS